MPDNEQKVTEKNYIKQYIGESGYTYDATNIRKQLAQKAYGRYAEQAGNQDLLKETEEAYIAATYPNKKDEYLVNKAVLTCTMTTKAKKTYRGKKYEVTFPYEKTFLSVTENTSASCCGDLYHATVKDTKKEDNIPPFRCNCILAPYNDKEWEALENDESCIKEGTCRALMNLNEEWDNLPQTGETDCEKINGVPAINMSSILFCKHGGIITAVKSGQAAYSNRGPGKFVGYLAYGAKSITQNPEEGYYMLYDGPTVAGIGDCYMFADIYAEHYPKGYGALQGYGGKWCGLNTEGEHTAYGGETKLDTDKGTLIYDGIERHAVAIGPSLQNPDFNKETKIIDPYDMAYGTCLDVTIELNSQTYYIPAVIVDVKAHTKVRGNSEDSGYFQTNLRFDNKPEGDGKGQNIVEWYVKNEEGSQNKSTGLGEFDVNGGIIIYRDEVMD